jgi:2-hydroxy-3-keto-5-methylthiopentenyl-1-phosphate phosphatase
MLPRGYPARMLPVGAVIVDFDGTACLHDVAEHLLMEFADPSWSNYDVAWERGEIGGRDALSSQAAMLSAPLNEMLRFAIDHCPMDPTFGPFVEWSMARDIQVTLVSDGFGFYIEPLLDAYAIVGPQVITNDWQMVEGLGFRNGHPRCVGCGTCKKQAVEHAQASFGHVAFVGEGPSDRFGARYADVTFAKVGESLIRHCESEGIPFREWTDFNDVRAGLEGLAGSPVPLGGEPCPGWRDPT